MCFDFAYGNFYGTHQGNQPVTMKCPYLCGI